eukprot:jgi/Picsp_1/3913/NSC_01425-R1_protein
MHFPVVVAPSKCFGPRFIFPDFYLLPGSHHNVFNFRCKIPSENLNLTQSCSRVRARCEQFKDVEIQQGDLVMMKLRNGDKLYLEGIQVKRSLKLVCQNELLSVRNGEVLPEGFFPRISDPWLKKIPDVLASLKEIRRAQKAGKHPNVSLPSSRIEEHGIDSIELLYSLSQLEDSVQKDPSSWCDGSGPGDSPTELETVLLTAGEMLALLQGLRGIALVQTMLPLEMGGNNLPLLRPFVLTILKLSVEDKDVVIVPSTVGNRDARSVILSAKSQPHKQWSLFLASIGVQASLVAGSDYYKLLVGMMMGYKPENIQHHIENC